MTSIKNTILLVDDDQQFRDYMDELLTSQNYDVVLADNGEEGLANYTLNKPDLIITDIVMPEKEGIEMIMAVRKSDAVTPIVAVSGGNMGNANSYLNMASRLGANATLNKPFLKNDILEVLDELLPV